MDLMLSQALALREAGFAVHWCRERSKAPIASRWTTEPFPTERDLVDSYSPGYNLGFRTGKYSIVDGGEICVLDVDVRGGAAYADEAYAAANSIMEGGYTATVISGSGVGRHQYVQFTLGESPSKAATTLRESDVWLLEGRVVSPQIPGARPAWQVELLSTGKQVVMPPSVHPGTKKPYKWEGGKNPWV